MTGFGVTQDGFSIKGLDVILGESMARARQIFDPNLDLSATSPLRQILQATAAEDAELWKRMEDLYYSNFVSTAGGASLDWLGEDLGLARRHLFAHGQVTLTLSDPSPGRSYLVPEGTQLIAGQPEPTCYTTAPLTLSEDNANGTVAARSFERGPPGEIGPGAITGIDPLYAEHYLNLSGGTTIEAKNDHAFIDGDKTEADDVYRARLLGHPRSIWTLESVRRAVLDVDGVIDVLLFDPLGGVDVSQSYFNMFNFNERLFGGERRLGQPYFFDIVVAHEFVWPWRTTGLVPGVYERVREAVDRVRPISIFPNVIQANHIDVGVRAKVVVERGADQQAILAAIRQCLAAGIGSLKLGGDVLYSQVMGAFVEQPGVVDVQNLHLRRCPALFGRVTFGRVPFQSGVIEAAVGESLMLGPREIAVFRLDSDLSHIEVLAR